MTVPSKLRLGIAAIPVAAVLAFAGCGGSSKNPASATTAMSPPATAAPTATAPSGTAASKTPAQTIQVTADPTGKLEFVQTELTAKAGDITFALSNASSVPHNLAVEGNGVDVGPSETISGGQTTLSVTLKPGTYEFYCAVPGHREAGMQGTLTVT